MPTLRSSSLLAAAALPLLLVAAGCIGADDPPSEPVGTAADAITESAADKVAFDFFLAKGLTAIQSAGIIGNLDQESGMDPTIFQFGGGPGRGIAQWSAGGRWDTSSNANVVWYAGQMGEDKFSLNLQLEFIWWELTNIGYGFTNLKNATTILQAVTVFQNEYEICGACAQSNRIAHAQAAYDQFGSDVVGPTWAAHFVSQSWPFASAAPIQMTQYQAQTGSIDLKNTGNKTWPAGVVKLAPIPRDQASSLAASTWISPTRVSTLGADVAPGGTGHFEWDFYPQQAGDFQPYFGLVAEGVTWFADSGGPGDNVMQVKVHVAPGSPPPPMTTSSSAGAGGGAGGAPSTGQGGGAVGPPPQGSSTHASSGSGGSTGSSDGNGGAGNTPTTGAKSGCSVQPARASSPSFGAAFGAFALAGIAARRRRRR